MAEVTDVDIVSGLPTGGTGTVPTLSKTNTLIAARLPAALGAGSGLKVDGSGTALPVSGTFWQATQPVSGTFWQATQPVSGTFWQATQPISGTLTAVTTVSTITNVVHIDDNAGSITVDGTVTANATLAAETTKVIGTVNISAAQTIAAVTALTNALPAGTNAIGKLAANSGVNIGTITVDSAQLGNLGQAAMTASVPVAVANNQSWPTGMSPRAFSVAFATLTRPANQTAYSAGDSISDNATAGSVTALVSGNISDTNDDPLTITEILVSSTDTGLNGKKLRAYLFRSDPTASSGVGAGDNAAYSQKIGSYIGSFQGWMETGFSDGAVGRLVPTFNETNYSGAGGFVVAKPASGAKTLWIQYQAVEVFTPSANSTIIVGTAKGFQGRAA